MKQRSRACGGMVLNVDYVFFAETVEHASHQVKGAERMCEARMFRALIGVEAQAELLDASQSLKLSRVDQTHHQFAFATVGAKANDVMDRIAIDSFRHFWGFLNNRKSKERQCYEQRTPRGPRKGAA